MVEITPNPGTPPVPAPQPINGQPSGLKVAKKWSKKRKIVTFSILGFAAVIIGLLLGGWIWYQVQLSPKAKDSTELIKITIESGSTPKQISALLEQKNVIRSSGAFDLYARLSNKQNLLQAGTYRLSPADSVPIIVSHLINGEVDQFSITFYPGATLTDVTSKAESKKTDVTSVLKRAGYTADEIKTGLSASYSSPALADKPASADLEGYVFGETYQFNSGATVQDIIQRTLDQLSTVVTDNGLVAKLKAHGLNLYEGITLASIIQREVSSPADEKQVAQVFYSRLSSGMMLGSDVTYQYIADKTGVARDPNLNSPYNTRRFAGLPPGPISAPGENALLAVANPSVGDYLFFLSGDDDVTYFARTNAEHEANITDHCKVKCATP
jgi:UPF0755 protein